MTTTTSIPPMPLPELAERADAMIRAHFPDRSPERDRDLQVIALAEECGEFIGAYRRWTGQARRTGPFADVRAELADVVITAYVVAVKLGVDLDAAVQDKAQTIFSRPWKDPR